MKIITLETLKTMQNGTVFSKISKFGEFIDGIKIITDRNKNGAGFYGIMNFLPLSAQDEDCKAFDLFDRENNCEYRLNEDFKTAWETIDSSSDDFSESSFYAVFSKAEVAKMIKVLQWALSDLEDDFDMDEVLI